MTTTPSAEQTSPAENSVTDAPSDAPLDPSRSADASRTTSDAVAPPIAASRQRAYFEENVGQLGEGIRFLARSGSTQVFLGDTSASLVGTPGPSGESATFTLSFGAGSPTPDAPRAEGLLAGRVNYLIGSDADQWRVGIPTYEKVRYPNVRPGVDVVFYFNGEGEFEYDIEVEPGGDLSLLEFSVEGSDALVLNADGSISAPGTAGAFHVAAPRSYEVAGDLRFDVPSQLEPSGEQTFRYSAEHDRSKKLIVDPTIAYSTSLPATGTGIAVDGVGNAVTVGSTSTPPPTFPITGGVVKGTLSGQTLGYVTKYSPDGSYMIYSTYIGGETGNSSLSDVKVDSASNAYIVGQTASADFPTVNAYQASCASCGSGATDGVIAELNETGTAFVYSTYFGGAGVDSISFLSRLSNGDLVIAGTAATSTAFPLTEAQPGPTYKSFLSAITSDGSTLLTSKFFSPENLRGMGTDTFGRVFTLVGYPSYSWWSAGAMMHRFAAGTLVQDLSIFEHVGIQWSFSGGVPKFAVDPMGNHFIANSFTWETCSDCYPMYYNDAVAKFDPDGNNVWQQTLNYGSVTALASDLSGNAIVSTSVSQPYVNSVAHGSPSLTLINGGDGQTRFSTAIASTPGAIAANGAGDIFLARGGVIKIGMGSWSHLTGNIPNGSGGIVYAFRKSDNEGAGLTAVDGLGNFDLMVPTSGACPSSGYKIMVDGVPGFVTTWYDRKLDINSADCLVAPSSGISFGFLPGAPSGVGATAISPYQVRLVWSSVTSDSTVFKIERKVGAGSFVEIAEVASGVTQFDDLQVDPVVTYSYRIRTVNPFGTSAYSSTASATTPAPPPPAAPSDLTAIAMTSSQIELSWSDNSSDELFFRIERDSGGGFTQIATATASATTFVDSSVTSTATYWYRVKAHGVGGESAYSNSASATAPLPTPPAPPDSLSAGATSAGRIDLTWTDNSFNEAGFKIERNSGAGFVQISATGPNTTSFADVGLPPSTPYGYRVRAWNIDGDSPYSNEVTATTTSFGLVTGVITNGSGGTLAIYDTGTGAPVASQTLLTETFSVSLPSASCPAAGYKLSVTAPAGAISQWYLSKPDEATADCVSSPGIANMTLAPTGPDGIGAAPRSGTTNRVDITWTDTSAFESGFKIERDSGSGFVQIATVGANATNYGDASLAPGTSYSYRVRAYNAGGNSPFSSTAVAETLTSVTGTVTNGANGSVSIYDVSTGNQVGYTCCLVPNTFTFVVPKATCGSGSGYKIFYSAPANYEAQWYLGRADYGSADCVSAPSTASVVLAPAAPVPPSGLTATATAPAAGRVDLTWTDNSTNETGFKIERDSGSGFNQIGTTGANITTYTDVSVANGSAYSYRVRANNGISNSGYSNVVSVTVPYPSPPNPPSNLTAVPAGAGEIALTWTDNSTNELGFRVQRDAGSGFTDVAAPGANTTTFTDTGLPASTAFTYRVIAFNAGGESSPSPTAQATTTNLAILSGSVTNGANGSVSIYEVATGNQVGYTCCLIPSTYSFTLPASSCSSGGGYKILVTAGPGYYTQWYSNKSTYSAADCVDAPAVANVTLAEIPPAAPIDLTATSVGIGRIDLTWTDTSSNEGGFKVERDSGSGFVQIWNGGPNVRTLTNATLDFSTTYSYRVRAYNSGGDSAYSNVASATTSNLAIISGSVVNGTNGSISVYDVTGTQVGYSCCLSPNTFSFTVSGSRCSEGGGFKIYVNAPAGFQSQWYSNKTTFASADCITPPASGTNLTLVPPPTLPSPPTALTATAVSPFAVSISWSDNSNNESGFKVERDSGSGFAEITTVAANATSMTDLAVSPSMTYTYRVRATNLAGDSSYSNSAGATTPASNVTISGTVTNGQWGSVSLFNASTGSLVGYTCCLQDQTFTFTVPASSCPLGGYKLYISAPVGYQSQWYSSKGDYTSADCIDSATPLAISLASAAVVDGYVKDYTTSADLDGLPVYAFDAYTGSFVGWAISGQTDPGRFTFNLPPGGSYKLKVAGDAGHEDSWFSGAPGYSEATAVTSPGSADFSLRAAGLIAGTVTQSGLPLQNAYISAYPSCGCTTPVNAISDASGAYSLKVLDSSMPGGTTYRVRFIPPTGQTRWYSDASGFGGASDIAAPSGGIDQETPP